jgi:voltage-gated potassium channel Kch
MALTPLLLVFNERVLAPRIGTKTANTRAPDVVEERNRVLIAGFGAFGSTVGRLLRSQGVGTTVLDVDPDRVDLLRRMGLQVYYGDAKRHDLLETAGAAHAELIVISLDSPAATLDLVHTVRKHFPNLRILARAFDWQDAHDLQEAGVERVYRDTLDTSLRTGADALRLLGFRAHHAERATQTFLRHDEESLRELTKSRQGEHSAYITDARRRIQELERILLADLAAPPQDRDAGWDPETLREEYRDA